MALNPTRYLYIVLDERGFRIAGTQLRVTDLVEAKQANGLPLAQLHEQHLKLTFAQISSALAYLWDHQEQLNAAIAVRRQEIDQLKRQTWPSRLLARLRQHGGILGCIEGHQS
ncbi:MAG TPA: hypothetical protein VLA19_19870 [Herpetosiphonaceae bacterium]|nr:hypothetical protein [Herpetosiphonaceae bacterium]